MDIDQLIAFDRIVRAGSFSRAAWGLHIAQPTISARIQALEQEVPIVDLAPVARDSALVRLARQPALSVVGTAFAGVVRQQAARMGILSASHSF